MLDESRARKILEYALSKSKAEQTQALLYVKDLATTRFAKNYIHQNVSGSEATLMVKAVVGKRAASASTNNLSEESVQDAVFRALSLAKIQSENPFFVPLPAPAPVKKPAAFIERTARCTPEERARGVSVICSKARDSGLLASGTFSTGVYQTVIANSLGLFASHMTTLAEATSVVLSDTSSGYAEHLTIDMDEIDMESVARTAIEKAVKSKDPVALEPGEYEVILEDHAVGDILSFLGYLGFSAQAVQEGRSFMGGKIGLRVLPESISIWDDGLGRGTIPVPFDFEGVPKRKVEFISKGIANAVCYDSYTAAKEGKSSTGHAGPPGEAMGPIPMNMFLKTGKATLDDMIASTQRGLWITRFHYTRTVHPLKVIVTGMTRDGTFLVEKGEVRYPVKNLRFTQSYVDALNGVQLIGKEAKLRDSEMAFNVVPALKLSKFSFTGATEF